jgi:2-phosphosulfolactate phosphatase
VSAPAARAVDRRVSVSSTATYGVDEGPLPVVIDVIRSTTTAVTALATGRRCFVAASIEEAEALARTVESALLAGEVAGVRPAGFDLNNSPAEIATRRDVDRPLVLVSSSGTRVMVEYGRLRPVVVACLRNVTAVARHLASVGSPVHLIGAESRGEFRDEDQLCAAWIAERLIEDGYRGTDEVVELVERWRGAPVEAIESGASAAYLRGSGQGEDLEFVLEHVDDLPNVAITDGREVVLTRSAFPAGIADRRR